MTTEVVRENFLSVQVCSDVTDIAALTEEVNRIHECGTQLGWVYDESLGAVQCETMPDRKHYVFHA